MNYAKLLNYSKNHLQPNVIHCMKQVATSFAESQQERVYSDLIINGSHLMSPVKFKFSNTSGTISLTVPYVGMSGTYELTETIPGNTMEGSWMTNQRLVSHLIKANGWSVCKETLLQVFPDLSFEFLSTFSSEDWQDIQNGFNIFRFRGKVSTG